jgi:hypothetical protein
MKAAIISLLVSILVLSMFAGCTPQSEKPAVIIERESKIPASQIKITPDTDILPPILHSDEYEPPVPMPYPVNTAGAEDSGFIMPDGNTFYVWFTPDPAIPANKQLFDGVTGIYVSKKVDGHWQKPELVVLQDPGKLALDGCEFIQGNKMWFCSAREGYEGMNMFTAEYINGKWGNWKIAGFPSDYQVGELHISTDGKELYFHSARAGGMGQDDIWVSENINGVWQSPQNVAILNSPESDSRPSLTHDGKELWFTRTYTGSPALYRSKRINGQWQEPELMVSQFAAESSIDNDGNIYFTHHFFKDGKMLEADIYMMEKK